MASYLPTILYALLFVPLLFAWWARSRVRDAYREESQVEITGGASGLEAAQALLEAQGLDRQVRIEVIPGRLNDHYDPERKVLRLSHDTAAKDSVMAVGIVGHEVGHAMQDAQGYGLMRVRILLAGWLSGVAHLSPFLFIAGALLGNELLMFTAVALLALQVVFSFITLPLERNASRRAMDLLQRSGLIAGPAESARIRRVLRAATFTYLVAVGQRTSMFVFWALIAVILTGAWPMA
jgi:uncharacterized protein